MSYKAKLVIKGLPKTTNNGSRGNWRGTASEARKWNTLIERHVYIHLLKPEKPLTKAQLTLTRHAHGRHPDFDGLVSSFKYVIDGLVTAGVLEDDSYAHIGQSIYKWEKAPMKEGFVTIEIEEQ